MNFRPLHRWATCLLVLSATTLAFGTYFPPPGDWQRKNPSELGLNSARLAAAVAFAQANENPYDRDIAVELRQTFGAREPLFKLLGPTQPRGGPSGIVVRRGYVAATWGDLERTDMTHSVAKTFVTTVVGLAWQGGLLRDLHEPVRHSLPTSDLFSSEHNRPITWDHLLRQTSDWSGTLWDMPDWADRPVGEPAAHAQRPMHAPGSHFKYNDVRINLLALCALQLWREPLPVVLRERVMQPIGASPTWRWHGYDNSWIVLDGQRVQSVSGGGHFGGGMFISAWDLARFGYLFLRDGRWDGKEIVSPKWIALARTPTPANPEYGFANWYLNPGRKALPAAPETAVTFRGNGLNIIYLDQENDLLVVVRWLHRDKLEEFIRLVLVAIE